ncbi:MAG: hypothetical protein NTZ81_05205 [Actinobacteria bacterium]|nr:hypothetical protein [Actinomycetota bacterium]
MSSEKYVQTVFTDAIAQHLALRQQNAPLEEQMPLRDYLPVDYLRVDEPTANHHHAPVRQWFQQDNGDALDWAA